MKRINFFGNGREQFKISYIPSSEDTGLPLIPLTMGITKPEIHVNWPPLKKNYVVCSLEGEGRVFLNGEWVAMPAGRVAYIPYDSPVIYEPIDEKDWSTSYITFCGSSAENILGKKGYVCDDKRLSFITEEIKLLKDHFDDPDWDALCYGLLYRIIISLRKPREQNEFHFADRNDYSVMQKVHVTVQNVNERFCEDLSLPMLAEKAQITEQYYCRLFKKITGTNFTNYVNSLRISRACTMLMNHPDYRIDKIAFDCGFQNPAYFNKIFKREIGVTPTEFRESHK